jgi:hypothetical protein
MIYVLLLLTLILLGAVAWLVKAVLDLRKSHQYALRKMESAWNERMQRLESRLTEKAEAERLRHIASMVDGVASVAQRMEFRLAAVEATSQPAKSGEPGN